MLTAAFAPYVRKIFVIRAVAFVAFVASSAGVDLVPNLGSVSMV